MKLTILGTGKSEPEAFLKLVQIGASSVKLVLTNNEGVPILRGNVLELEAHGPGKIRVVRYSGTNPEYVEVDSSGKISFV